MAKYFLAQNLIFIRLNNNQTHTFILMKVNNKTIIINNKCLFVNFVALVFFWLNFYWVFSLTDFILLKKWKLCKLIKSIADKILERKKCVLGVNNMLNNYNAK